MKILFLSPTVDTAGLGIGMKRAFDQHGGSWSARHVRCENSWLDYPRDIQWDRSDASQTTEVMTLWREADVVVLIERPTAREWFPQWPPKPVIVWHLGTWYRRDPGTLHAQCQGIGATEVVDMHDLMRFGVEAWLPDVIDPKPLAAIRGEFYQRSEVVRIAHAPTDRVLKSTDVIVASIERLKSRYPIEFDLIERVPNAECLARKARADLFVDELTLGYGLNALECWSMGISVISGIANPETKARMERDFGELPFANATEDTLDSVLERLVSSPKERRHYASIGMTHVDRFHSPQAVVRKMIELATERLAVAA